MIQPAILMTIIGIMVGPVNNSPLGIPFIFTIKIDVITYV